MLVLSRKPTEDCVILDPQGNLISRVTIVRMGQGNVRLGIEAPRNYTILRAELYDPPDADVPSASEVETP